MADFAPPTGPPPPKVPEGWKAVWNEQYKEWFYVNVYTKQSQWDKPTEPIYAPGESASAEPLAGAPPVYDQGMARPVQPEKTGASTGEQMFGGPGAPSQHVDTSGDEEFARKLQEEENARQRSHAGGPGDRGAADSYYNDGIAPPQAYGQNSGSAVPPYNPVQNDDSRGKSKGGFLGKLLGKAKAHSQSKPAGYPPQPAGYYQGPPPQAGYGYPQQGYYGQPGYPPGGMMRPGKRPGGGLGAGGAAALGVGGGLLGGAMLGSALAGDHGGDDGGYGGDDGGGFGGDGGGGFGGDDGGGFGGDDGGGDFGGGDF